MRQWTSKLTAMPPVKQDAVQEIKDRLDLVDLISEHLRLQKAGRDLKGLCPSTRRRPHPYKCRRKNSSGIATAARRAATISPSHRPAQVPEYVADGPLRQGTDVIQPAPSAQVRLLKRETQELLLAFDRDDAGLNATQRAIELATKSGIYIKVVRVMATH